MPFWSFVTLIIVSQSHQKAREITTFGQFNKGESSPPFVGHYPWVGGHTHTSYVYLRLRDLTRSKKAISQMTKRSIEIHQSLQNKCDPTIFGLKVVAHIPSKKVPRWKPPCAVKTGGRWLAWSPRTVRPRKMLHPGTCWKPCSFKLNWNMAFYLNNMIVTPLILQTEVPLHFGHFKRLFSNL